LLDVSDYGGGTFIGPSRWVTKRSIEALGGTYRTPTSEADQNSAPVDGFVVPAVERVGNPGGATSVTTNVTFAPLAQVIIGNAAAMAALSADAVRLEGLRNQLERGLRQAPEITVFAEDVPRLPNTVLFTVPGLKAETAVIGFDLAGIAVSSGSACSSGKVQPSHVLAAMGFGPDLAQGAVRLSLGWSTSEKDVNRCLEAWRKLSSTLLRGGRNTA